LIGLRLDFEVLSGMAKSQSFEIDNLKASIRPTRQRFALLQKTEAFEGIIVIPNNANQQYLIGQVLKVGNAVTIDLHEDDLVLYQSNKMFEAAVTHRINDTPVSFWLQGDMIGKLSSTVVNLENFTILGDWILIEEISINKVGNLYLPQSSIPPPEFRVIQLGSTANNDQDPVVQNLKVGDEIYVDRSRASKLRIGQKTYFYISKGWLHGVNPTAK
jgi:co-chaperonin GroES (HSP10)